MNAPAIKVEHLAKTYRIFHRGSRPTGQVRYRRLSETLSELVRRPLQWRRQDCHEEFHALSDLSFAVHRGEVVGIIGKNGAGKSTLLKILSRITPPTKGQIELDGRVVSLLEVGTGFHPELTGRENIFLNGAILGMSRSEIRRKFAAIVEFAEVEKFLDTPVKHYSSGMYVRLAFSVAAHLDPEILIIDEVLAVGDAAFQNKCLGKMREVATSEGRTVLFVSHNMSAVLSLCTRCILLSEGRIVADGIPSEIVERYFQHGGKQSDVVDLTNSRRQYDMRGKARLSHVTLVDRGNGDRWKIGFGQSIEIQLGIQLSEPLSGIMMGSGLSTAAGFEIASSKSSRTLIMGSLPAGAYQFRATTVGLALTPGLYRVGLEIRSDRGLEDYIGDAFAFEVVVSEAGADAGVEAFRGAVVPRVEYRLLTADGAVLA